MAAQGKTRGTAPTKGLYVSAMSDLIPPDYTPWCQNVRFRFGEVIRAPGRSRVLETHPTAKSIMDFGFYMDSSQTDGLKRYFAFCANTNNLTQNEAREVNTTNFTLGTPLTLANSSLNQRFSWCQGEDRLFVVRQSTVTAIRTNPIPLSPALADPVVGSPNVAFLEYFSNRVFGLRNIIANTRVQWAALGDYTNWVTAGSPPPGGFLDLFDASTTPITGGKVLNNRLVIYREDAITDFVSTGDATTPFLPENRVNGIGCLFPWTLQSTGQHHFFLGNDYMVYMWDGIQLAPIGQPVHSYIRRLVDRMNIPWYVAPFGALFKGFKEYYLVLQSVESNYREVLIFDYVRGTWTRDYFEVPVDKPFGGIYEIVEPGPTTTMGFDNTDYPAHYPMLLASKDDDLFVIDERILGDRLRDPSGGMDMWFDTIDMYFTEDSLGNGTVQRILTSQKFPMNSPTDEPYYVEVIIDRGANVAASVAVTPSTEHAGFEFADFNVTSNVRRYRFHYYPTSGPARPTWRGWSDTYVPSGDFFPTKRPATNTIVPPVGTS